MNPFRKIAIDLADRAKKLHEAERLETLESIDLIAEMQRYNARAYLHLDLDGLAKRVGLSPDQFRKRSQAARVIRRFPEFRELLATGQTTVTNLRLIAPRVTPANKHIFLDGVRGKSARSVRQLAGGVACDGTSLISKDRRAIQVLTERALDVVHRRGRRMNADAVVKEALENWLLEWDDSGASRHDAECASRLLDADCVS